MDLKPAADGPAPRVVVFGGSGFFGSRLARELLDTTSARLVLASRRPHLPPSLADGAARIELCPADLGLPATLARAVQGASAVVHAAGPFRGAASLAHACITAAVPYLDLAEEPGYHARVRALAPAARERGILLAPGLSSVPALSALLAARLRLPGQPVDAIETSIAPGSRGSRGNATFRSLLDQAGRTFLLPGPDGPRTVHGFSAGRWIEHPPPVGRRLSYLALPTPELDLFGELFGAGSLSFRAGSEFPAANRLLAGLAALRRRTGFPPLSALTPVLRAATGLAGRFGVECGALTVELRAGASTRRASVVGVRDAARIATVLAAIAVQRLLDGRLTHAGLPPWTTWLGFDELCTELASRDLAVWLDEGSGWRRV